MKVESCAQQVAAVAVFCIRLPSYCWFLEQQQQQQQQRHQQEQGLVVLPLNLIDVHQSDAW